MEEGQVAVANAGLASGLKHKNRLYRGFYPPQGYAPQCQPYAAPTAASAATTTQQARSTRNATTATQAARPTYATASTFARRGVKHALPFNRAAGDNAQTQTQTPQMQTQVQTSNAPSISGSNRPTAFNATRGKERRSFPPYCATFFRRGSCHYGASCKYSHDSAVFEAYQATGNNSEVRNVSATATQTPSSSALDARRSSWNETATTASDTSDDQYDLHNAHFPSLTPQRRMRSISHSNPASPSHSPQTASSSRDCPTKKLVFRDAVLGKQASRPDQSPTTQESTTAGSNAPAQNKTRRQYYHAQASGQEKAYSGRWIRASNSRSANEENRQPYSARSHPNTTAIDYQDGGAFQVDDGSFTPNAVYPSDVVDPGYQTDYDYAASQQAEHARFRSRLNSQADALVDQLDHQLKALEPCHEAAIGALQSLVQNLWPDAVVGLYGSNYTRLALPTSDIDCMLMSQTAAHEEPAVILRRLASRARQEAWAQRVDLLDTAKIPVLKIVYSASGNDQGVLLDLTCAHSPGHSGLSARDLIYSYQAQMPALRPLVLLLKSHMQANDLNSAYTGGLSSYALVLLVIRFLQSCGDEHYKTYDVISTTTAAALDATWPHSEESEATSPGMEKRPSRPTWAFVFSRNGIVGWKTGLGDLLVMFLETYVLLDYRRVGISIEGAGDFFPLPMDRVPMDPSVVVSPFIADPIKSGRNVTHCFRMHEVIQAWYDLYQRIAHGMPLREALYMKASPVASPA